MPTGVNVGLAADYLRQGKLVAMPTETVYGLAARAADSKAVTSVFAAKNRPSFDPLILHIGDLALLDEWVLHVPEKARRLLEKVWPGPLTLLLPKSEKVSDLITSGNPGVAIRMPAHELALQLLKELGEPVVAPSANPFGYVSPTTAEHVEQQLGNKVDYILDGGPTRIGLESTIVSFMSDTPEILRLGGLSVEDLTELMGEVPLLNIATHSNPQAPGQLDRHYATGTPLIQTQQILSKASELEGKRLALLSFQNDYPEVAWVEKRVLSPSGDLNEAAAALFSAMRELDKGSIDFILAEYFPDQGLGRAINDRLKRASLAL